MAQVVHYLRAFRDAGEKLPNVIVSGDEDEVFVYYAPKLYRYLDGDYDWSIAPSSAYEDEKLYRDIAKDENIRDIFIFKIDSTFDIHEVFAVIDELREVGDFVKMRVDEANLRKAFDDFVRLVFEGDSLIKVAKKIGAPEMVSIFINSILGKDDVFIHPNKPNILVMNGREIRIRGAQYNAFFSRYDRRYTPSEIAKITAIADRLIEEIKRRFHGDFWTPTIWADEAIKMMDRDLGEGWRDEYVIWDCAAGTKNLTRDYKFKHLFTSTLHQAEIDMSTQYNPGSTSFQYDFLNDDIDVSPDSDPRDLKMPKALFEALKENKPIVFYTNPPYGQATEQGESSKAGVAKTKIQGIMDKEGYGHAQLELYTQFIYRVQKLTRDFDLKNVFFFFFFNKGFLSSSAFGKFTDELLRQFQFNDGFMLNAGEFQGTSSNWGIIFSNFSLKKNNLLPQEKFKFDIVRSGEHGGVEKIAEHELRRVSKKDELVSWLGEIKLSSNEYNGGDYPRVIGGFNSPSGNSPRGKYKEGAIGYMHNNGCNVQFSDKYTNLNTSMNYADNGNSITPDNFERACVTFACRKSILPDASWVNDKDIFRKPSQEFQDSPEWNGFVKDCVVYSLFHRSSYQTALKDFDYKGEFYDVKNEWFFMSREQMMELAQKNEMNDMYYDARGDDERFVYDYLKNKQLSEEARGLLDAGKRFVEVCFTKRFIANDNNPEYCLMTWDAGYYQNYKIYRMFEKDEKIAEAYQVLDSARTKLETKIRKRVYADGILTK
ncbi:hypothetical protein J5500_03125 [Candidatus Saccharibacteria bacterium]|nr:hypothetical protein [Candidatus Saccharibacteria bacterium]